MPGLTYCQFAGAVRTRPEAHKTAVPAVSKEYVPLVTNSPVEIICTPEHDAAEIVQGSFMVGGHVGDAHRGSGGNPSTEKTWRIVWICRFVRVDLIKRILKSVVVGRRIVF